MNESRYTTGMRWPDLVRAWLPAATDPEVHTVLWDLTCYPFGDRQQVEEQLVRIAAFWPDLERLSDLQDAELELGLGRRCPAKCYAGYQEYLGDTPCETCGGDGRVDHLPEQQAHLLARIQGTTTLS